MVEITSMVKELRQKTAGMMDCKKLSRNNGDINERDFFKRKRNCS